MKDDLEARIRAVIQEVSRKPIPPIGPDDDLVEKLALDSLEGLHILAAIEKRLGVRFPDDRLSELRTVRRIAEAVRGCERTGGPGT